jgi:hypothetical protein
MFSLLVLLVDWPADWLTSDNYFILVVCAVLATSIAVLIVDNPYSYKNVYMKVYYKPTGPNEEFINRVRNNVGLYVPPWWYSAVLGILIPFGRDLPVRYEREIHYVDNDATFAVDWFPKKPVNVERPAVHKIIVFLPGLGLTSQNVCAIARAVKTF